MKKIILSIILICLWAQPHATTWDEPWADEVIRQSSSFVFARITDFDEEQGISIEILKTLGGDQLNGTLKIEDFYLLKLCSSSGHGVEFPNPSADSCYFFLSRNQNGKYCIATPTAGFDFVSEGKVAATYRHSYHKALVPVATYEKTMIALFNYYHDKPYDRSYINSFTQKYLNEPPADLNENRDAFFMQHVALECIYHLKPTVSEKLLIPFLKHKENWHNQISAARAMEACNNPASQEALMTVIEDTTQDNFVKVMCTWSLKALHPVTFKKRLQQLAEKASEESDGFGGNIMDPRICTHIPSVKSALHNLLTTL